MKLVVEPVWPVVDDDALGRPLGHILQDHAAETSPRRSDDRRPAGHQRQCKAIGKNESPAHAQELFDPWVPSESGMRSLPPARRGHLEELISFGTRKRAFEPIVLYRT